MDNWRELRPGDPVLYVPHDETEPKGWGIITNLDPGRDDCFRVRIGDRPIALFHKSSLRLMTTSEEKTIG